MCVSKKERLLTPIPIKTEAMPDIAISRALLDVRNVRKITPVPISIKIKTRG
jgi:hypothetical protein